MSDPLWYKDAIVYQLRIPSFYDSDGDGIGDLRGLTEKLDYLQDLGVTALWLLPFYPSPLRDDGYDIAGYTEVHPDYGTLRDFRALLREAHRRGLRVITELVINHTSDQHPWFQRARRAPPGDRARDFYVWSDTPERYRDARIIFKDFEHSNWSWDPVARAYYWHRFYAHQPDLNFDNPAVRRAVIQAMDFWLEMGVDGLRLDAIPYLFEREGTSCENLPETHAFLKELRSHVDQRHQDKMLLAEANQWPEDAVAYFGKGDECHMAFHFPVMPRLFMAIHVEDRFPILDILDQTPAIPDTCQWALFLRNHDELTLEMVTDEERDYMWRVYARDRRSRVNLGIRRRLAPLLENNRRRIELMNALLLSLPGTPIIYYGDEIGMGDNVYLGDRNGVRTPMQWGPDRNAGFSRANPQQLFLPVVADPEFHFEAVNVEVQQANPSSLLWWTKRILGLRKQFRAFGCGSFEPLSPANRQVLAFIRRFEGECLLVVANLSRFAQYAELDLSAFTGSVPVELFGRTAFPPVQEGPYRLSLGPHGFYWFSLEAPAPERADVSERRLAQLDVRGAWPEALIGGPGESLSAALRAWLPGQRWFRGKARRIKGVQIADCVPLSDDEELQLAFVRVSYAEGEGEVYALPLVFRPGSEPGGATLGTVRQRGRRGEETRGVLDDGSADPRLGAALLDLVLRRRRLRGQVLELQGVRGTALRRLLDGGPPPPARLLGAEQSNTSWLYGEKLVGKLVRRVDEGTSPDLELTRFLTEHAGFPQVPPFAGHIEVRAGRRDPATLVLFQGFVPNEGDAWRLTLDEVERYFEEVLTKPPQVPPPPPDLAERLDTTPPEEAALFGMYLEQVRLLGRRTAELHVALARGEEPTLAPEPITPFSRRSHYQSLRNLAVRGLEALRDAQGHLGREEAELARRVLAAEERILSRLREMLDRPTGGRAIRCHGDYHLGQVLHTGRDFAIIDFEGEPARSLAERSRKRSPLADVAGMLRSFHYAVEHVLAGGAEGSRLRPEDVATVAPWGRFWYAWISSSFLRDYLDAVAPARVLPESREELLFQLDLHLLEKALYELGYELNNRPDWVHVPLRGVLDVLGA
jgi:maltose alpha-D-glucosyltransferase/alpha-amylase